jgi:hypothetical protein
MKPNGVNVSPNFLSKLYFVVWTDLFSFFDVKENHIIGPLAVLLQIFGSHAEESVEANIQTPIALLNRKLNKRILSENPIHFIVINYT